MLSNPYKLPCFMCNKKLEIAVFMATRPICVVCYCEMEMDQEFTVIVDDKPPTICQPESLIELAVKKCVKVIGCSDVSYINHDIKELLQRKMGKGRQIKLFKQVKEWNDKGQLITNDSYDERRRRSGKCYEYYEGKIVNIEIYERGRAIRYYWHNSWGAGYPIEDDKKIEL